MRIFVYLIIVSTIGGLAGLYQLDSLMVLFVTGIFLFILLFGLSWYLKGKVSAEFQNNQDLLNKGDFFFGTIKLTNLTRLPIVHIRLWLEWENRMTGQKGKDILQGTCPPLASAELEYVWEAEACGEVHFQLIKIETSDFFRLFKQKSRIEEKTVFLVLPFQESIAWSLAAPPEGEETGPYQQGDMVKHIHWKLSARMDDLLVRHYRTSVVPEAVLYLELKTWPESEPEKAEAFLSKLASVLAMLVQEGWVLRLVWNSVGEEEDVEPTQGTERNEGTRRSKGTGRNEGTRRRIEAEKREGTRGSKGAGIYKGSGGKTGIGENKESGSDRIKEPKWSECMVQTQQDYLEAMGEVMEALGRRRKKLPKKKGRFGAVLDLYGRNEEKKTGSEGIFADEEEVLLQLNFTGEFYVNHVLVELEEEE